MVEPSSASPIDAPPAYELSQLNFDQKLAVATERSLVISDSYDEPVANASGKEPIEESDEAHQAVASRSSGPQAAVQPNAQLPSVRPLAFRKKPRTALASGSSSKDKERPSWFNDAQLDASSSNASSRSRSVAREPHGQHDRSTHHVLPEESEEDHSIPPPPFVAVDTTLDGPAYERYPQHTSRRRRANAPVVVLRYNGEDLGASPPPSPPQSPIVHNSSSGLSLRHRAASPPINPVSNNYQQQQRLQIRTPVSRPSSAGPQHYVQPAPRLNFDPSIAYGGSRSSMFDQMPAELHETNRDPAALYSSAVAPHMSLQKSRPAPVPKMKRYAASISSLPEYEQPQIQHTAASIKPLYSVPDYAASRTSVYSQNSVAYIPQYPQMAQYPTQQTYTHSVPMPQQGGAQRWSTAGGQYPPQQYYQR